MSPQVQEARALTYEIRVDIDAPPERVWESLTNETNAWWLPDFHMTGGDSSVKLDARAGGQLIEESPDGASLLWYTVQLCMPCRCLELVGHLSADFGGPATTHLKLALEANENTTVLTIRDSIVGCVDEGTARSLESGWTQLFAYGLRVFVEGS